MSRSVQADDDVVDRNEDQLDEEANESHDSKANRRGECDLAELCDRAHRAVRGGRGGRGVSSKAGSSCAIRVRAAREEEGGIHATAWRVDTARTRARTVTIRLGASLDQTDAVPGELLRWLHIRVICEPPVSAECTRKGGVSAGRTLTRISLSSHAAELE